MNVPTLPSPGRSRPATALLLAGASVVATLAALAFLVAPPPVRGSSSLYSVVRADTQESVTAQLVRVNSGGAAVISVAQKEKIFLPAAVEIRVGQSIEIVNDDNTVHNAYCSAGEFKYNSGPQQPGSKSSLTFTAAGTYEVRCAIHPKMRLSVTVAP